MKKIIYVLVCIIALCGCGMMNNTPTKKVEELLNKYQSNDIDVVSDLSDVLMSDFNMTDDEKNDYASFMKKHYQDMMYKIKDEKIDGERATVETEITVRDYSDAVKKADEYRLKNPDKFTSDSTFASYRLKKLKDVKKVQTYTITFYLTKVKNEWQVDPMSMEDESKLNGLYSDDNITGADSNTIDENITTDDANITKDETVTSDEAITKDENE